jgi:CBS domain-containing protein
MINVNTSVRHIMTSPVILARADTSVEAIAEIMFAKSISAVPVVDDQNRPIGIVSKTDLLRVRHEEGDTEEQNTVGDPETGMHQERARATAGEVMTPMVFSVRAETPVATAAALMAQERIHRVPVVSATGEVVGILSALDVLEWLARGAGYIVQDHNRSVIHSG